MLRTLGCSSCGCKALAEHLVGRAGLNLSTTKRREKEKRWERRNGEGKKKNRKRERRREGKEEAGERRKTGRERERGGEGREEGKGKDGEEEEDPLSCHDGQIAESRLEPLNARF